MGEGTGFEPCANGARSRISAIPVEWGRLYPSVGPFLAFSSRILDKLSSYERCASAWLMLKTDNIYYETCP